MTVLIAIACAVLGVVAARVIVAESDAHRLVGGDAWWPASCPTCGSPLDAVMNRCAASAHPQRRSNPWVLGLSIGVGAAVALGVPSWWVLPAYLVFAWAMVLVTVTDLDTKLIPNRVLLPTLIVGGSLLVAGGLLSGEWQALLRAAGGGVAYFALMLLLALVARGALGFGDVKLAFVIGVFSAYLGWGELIIASLGAFILGGVVSLVLVISRRVSRKDSIPFGPFMTAAAVIAVVFGDAIVSWYLR